MTFIYYDFETTGLNPYHEKIIEYCFIKQDGSKIKSLVNPGIIINKKIEEITEINNEMLKQQLSIESKKNEIKEFLNIYNSEVIFLVAHNNCNFDRFFFKNIFNDDPIIGPILNTKVIYIDSIHLAKYLLPNQKSFNLKYLCNMFGIVPGDHRAESDTIALKKLFYKLLCLLSKKENIELDNLLKNPRIVYNILY